MLVNGVIPETEIVIYPEKVVGKAPLIVIVKAEVSIVHLSVKV